VLFGWVWGGGGGGGGADIVGCDMLDMLEGEWV